MQMAGKISLTALLVICLVATLGCSPKVGSEKWCERMEEKSAADWTARETKDYAKHCVFK